MFCPIMKEECIREKCQWWSETYEDSCAINAYEILLQEIKENVAP